MLSTPTPIIGKRSRTRRRLNACFRVLVVVLLCVALYYELGSKAYLDNVWGAFLLQLSQAKVGWLLGTFFLMPVNWLVEVAKWRPFVLRYEPMSWRRAWLAIMAGVTFSLFTPNRVGEYGGRLLFIRPENHWNALSAHVVGSMAQLIVLLTGGAIGGIWFLIHFLHREEWLLAALFATLFGLGLFYIGYFNIKTVLPWVKRIPYARRLKPWVRDISLLQQVARSTLAKVLGWSALRYAVYSTQYYFMLQFFGIKTGLWEAYAGIATIFLLQTTVPLPALASLLVRGNLAVFVWSHFGANEVSSLAATFLLWIINLILPALVGTFSLFYVSIAKTFGYEDE